MIVLGLSSGAKAAWWGSLGAGLLVALVVWALLESLRRAVKAIEVAVADVLGMGGRLAQNTTAIQSLRQTEARTRDLHEELNRHSGSGGG